MTAPRPTAAHLYNARRNDRTSNIMPSVCFYFQVHQPFRLRRYSVFDTDQDYFDSLKNIEICKKVARKCYLPANEMLLENIQKHEGRFRVAFSISGVAREQFDHASLEVHERFHRLNMIGFYELLNELDYLA